MTFTCENADCGIELYPDEIVCPKCGTVQHSLCGGLDEQLQVFRYKNKMRKRVRDYYVLMMVYFGFFLGMFFITTGFIIPYLDGKYMVGGGSGRPNGIFFSSSLQPLYFILFFFIMVGYPGRPVTRGKTTFIEKGLGALRLIRYNRFLDYLYYLLTAVLLYNHGTDSVRPELERALLRYGKIYINASAITDDCMVVYNAQLLIIFGFYVLYDILGVYNLEVEWLGRFGRERALKYEF